MLWDCLAILFKPRVIPAIGKIGALFGFKRLNRAVIPIQEDAFTIGFIHERESLTIVSQAGIPLDEAIFIHLKVNGQTGDFTRIDIDVTWPATAGGATLTLIVDRHDLDLCHKGE